MKTTYHGEFDIAYEECEKVSEIYTHIDDFIWGIKTNNVSDDYRLTIVYKDWTTYDSFENPDMIPKKKNIYSVVISGDYGYTYFNAEPRFEEDDGDLYCYCDVKECEA